MRKKINDTTLRLLGSMLIGLMTTTWCVAASPPTGWQTKTLNFGAPDLRADIALPKGATLQTVNYEPRQPNTAGRSVVVGKVTPSKTVPADVSIVAFDLEYPAAAVRLCAYEVQATGLDVISLSVSDDSASADLRSLKADEGKPVQVGFTRCLTRGTKLLVFHFVTATTGKHDERTAMRTGKSVETFARTMLDDIRFADGKPASHWAEMQDIPLKLGQHAATLNVSPAWQVVINDFNGAVPAEMHMVRKRDGKNAGLVWLAALETPNGFDMTRDGQSLLRDFMAKQSPDFGDAKLLSNDALPLSEGASGTKHRFRFEIRSKSGGEAGDLLATLTHSGHMLYAVALWSAPVSGNNREKFMARLPGLTAYDLAQDALNRLLTH
ncbi:hypothetical protein BOTU111921_10790 [Bordetella tumbae]